MKVFLYKDKVRYCDCDMHQHLNHARYFSFFEQARVEFFAKIGLKPRSDYHSIPFIIAAAHCNYLAPVHLNDCITIRVLPTHIGRKSIHVHYEMRISGKGKPVATAHTVLVMYDYNKRKSVFVPLGLQKKIGVYCRCNATFSDFRR